MGVGVAVDVALRVTSSVKVAVCDSMPVRVAETVALLRVLRVRVDVLVAVSVADAVSVRVSLPVSVPALRDCVT